MNNIKESQVVANQVMENQMFNNILRKNMDTEAMFSCFYREAINTVTQSKQRALEEFWVKIWCVCDKTINKPQILIYRFCGVKCF